MTREEAIKTIINHIQYGYCLPMTLLGNGGAGLDWIDSNVNLEALYAKLKDTNKFNFRVVPVSEIAEDFKDYINLDNYDVCVEFASTIGDNPYREQFLLWL